MEPTWFYYGLVFPWLLVALIIFGLLFFIDAPYGRHLRQGWGPKINNRLGWILMELVSPLMLSIFFFSGDQVKSTPMWIFWGLWVLHYLNRSLVFPFRVRTEGKKMPLMIVLSAVFFNSVNGFINGYYLGYISGTYPESYLGEINFILGLILFIGGAMINIHSDEILLNLRKPGEKGYKIPQGGLFTWVSSPNYLGEMIEWLGFALMTGSLAGFTFALWTIANLAPRAFANHTWYREKFPDYPSKRKALIPFVY